MTIKRRMDRHGMVTTEIEGTISFADLLDATLELGELMTYSNEFWEIMILDDDVRIHRDNNATLESAHSTKEMLQFKSRGAIAVVTGRTKTRKVCQRFADVLRGDVIPVTVFDDESQARKWLDIHMEQARFTATTVPIFKNFDAVRRGRG